MKKSYMRPETRGTALLDYDVAKRALFQLQDAMNQSLVILDSELRLQSANRRFYEYFRLAPRRSRGRRLRALTGGRWNDAELNARLETVLATGLPLRDFELEHRFPRADRRLLRLGAVRVPNEVRAADALYLTLEDITDLRRAEEADRLEKSDRVQRDFIANISHELRTPVTAIKGYAQTLKDGGVDDRKNRGSFLDAIERNSDRLTRLIGDLLRISLLTERPAPRLRKLALGVFAKRCVEDLAPLAAKGGISVRIEIPPALKVSADRSLLLDVLQNLAVNAFRHSRPGGRVRIAAREAGAGAEIVVTDAGVGISRKDLPRIFERFYRTRGMRKSPGEGLGLSIVKQIVTAHGGRIWAEIRKGKGTTIRFTLPLWKAPERRRS